jgi:hypothetical protein
MQLTSKKKFGEYSAYLAWLGENLEIEHRVLLSIVSGQVYVVVKDTNDVQPFRPQGSD